MLKVVIIDDEIWIAQMIVHTIDWSSLAMELAGIASDGEEGETLIRATSPDIVITDVRMPVINGIELIERIRADHTLKQPRFVIVSGYDDFQYAQSALRCGVSDYILKPYNEENLFETLQKIKKQLDDDRQQTQVHNDVKKLLNTSIEKLQKDFLIHYFHRERSVSSFNEFSSELSCDLLGQNFTIASLKVYDSMWLFLNSDLKNMIMQIIQNYFSTNTYTGICITFFLDQRCCFLLNHKSDDKEHVISLIKSCFITLLNHPSLKHHHALCLGYSACDNYAHLLDAYDKAVIGSNLYLLGGHNRCYCLDSYNFDPFSIHQYFKGNSSTAIVHAFESLNRSKIEELISEVYQTLDNLMPISPAHYFNLGQEIIDILRQCCRKNFGGMVPENMFEDAYVALDSALTIQDFPTILTRQIANILLNVEEDNSDKVSLPIRQALDYIRDHFSEPIKMNDVAAQIYLSPQYFSELFKKEVGQNFSDYLANYRIEIAKQLILTPGEKIKNVGNQVGYQDSKSFSQVFKKHVGLTPVEYRKLYL